jgi:hypothetical protein
MITNPVDNGHSPMHYIHYTFREASTGTELSNDHGCTGIPLGWLEDEGITSNSSKGNCPERNHSE